MSVNANDMTNELQQQTFFQGQFETNINENILIKHIPSLMGNYLHLTFTTFPSIKSLVVLN